MKISYVRQAQRHVRGDVSCRRKLHAGLSERDVVRRPWNIEKQSVTRVVPLGRKIPWKERSTSRRFAIQEQQERDKDVKAVRRGNVATKTATCE